MQAIVLTGEKIGTAIWTRDSEESNNFVQSDSMHAPLITRMLCKAKRASLGQVNKFKRSLHWRELRESDSRSERVIMK